MRGTILCITATATSNNTTNFPGSLQDKRDHPLTTKAAAEWTMTQKKCFNYTDQRQRKKLIHFAINIYIHLVTDCEICRITPVNPCGARSLIAKDFVRETWWTMALGGPDSAPLKLWDLLQSKLHVLTQVKTQH